MNSKSLVSIALLLSLALLSFQCFATFVPHQGDYFSYYEVINVGSGTGDYAGYTDQTIVTGTENVNGVTTDGNVSAYYSYTYNFSSNDGSTDNGGSSGNFTFSSVNFLYINGTDDQTGYVNPTVWFCMDNSTLEGGTFYLLNTAMTVKSKNYSYYLPSEDRNVYAIFAQGSSSYQRDDVYGRFTATYTWNTYFDPSSGYIIGYTYNEQDTNSSGTGFTYTEELYITSASYPLTTAPASPPEVTIVTDVGDSPITIILGNSVTFRASVTAHGGTGQVVKWYFLGNNTSIGTGTQLSVTLTSLESHTLYAVVTDSAGSGTSNQYVINVTQTNPPNGTSDLMQFATVIAVIVIIIIIIAIISIIIYLASRSRRRLPKHPSQPPVYTPPSEQPPTMPPQDIDLTPKQAPVQQIVIKEVVKVKCLCCGALIDSTAEKCPFCGAPRS